MMNVWLPWTLRSQPESLVALSARTLIADTLRSTELPLNARVPAEAFVASLEFEDLLKQGVGNINAFITGELDDQIHTAFSDFTAGPCVSWVRTEEVEFESELLPIAAIFVTERYGLRLSQHSDYRVIIVDLLKKCAAKLLTPYTAVLPQIKTVLSDSDGTIVITHHSSLVLVGHNCGLSLIDAWTTSQDTLLHVLIEQIQGTHTVGPTATASGQSHVVAIPTQGVLEVRVAVTDTGLAVLSEHSVRSPHLARSSLIPPPSAVLDLYRRDKNKFSFAVTVLRTNRLEREIVQLSALLLREPNTSEINSALVTLFGGLRSDELIQQMFELTIQPAVHREIDTAVLMPLVEYSCARKSAAFFHAVIAGNCDLSDRLAQDYFLFADDVWVHLIRNPSGLDRISLNSTTFAALCIAARRMLAYDFELLDLLLHHPKLNSVLEVMSLELVGAHQAEYFRQHKIPVLSDLGVTWFPSPAEIENLLFSGLCAEPVLDSERLLLPLEHMHGNTTLMFDYVDVVIGNLSKRSDLIHPSIHSVVSFSFPRLTQTQRDSLLKRHVRRILSEFSTDTREILVLDLLIAYGADVNTSSGLSLLAAVVLDHTHFRDFLISRGAEISGCMWRKYFRFPSVRSYVFNHQPDLLSQFVTLRRPVLELLSRLSSNLSAQDILNALNFRSCVAATQLGSGPATATSAL